MEAEKKVQQESSLICAGDAFISKRLSVYKDERFCSLMEKIQRADVSSVNLETTIHHFDGYPIGEGKTDAYAQAEPYIADELVWAGFDLVSQANNHAMDYSAGGLFATIENLERVGLVHAGAGEDLAEAREPAYLETEKGIISLISACTYNLGLASYPRKGLPGRPGINPLRIETAYELDPDSFKALKNIGQKMGILPSSVTDDTKEFSFLTRDKFRLSDQSKVTRTLNKLDFEGNIKAVKEAKRLSDLVIFSLHDHSSATKVTEGFKTREVPCEPVGQFAHACVDSGTDVFIGHGPHVLRGIEVYKGKPIFYSLGNFAFQSTLITRQPSELFERWGLDINDSTADLYEKRETPPNHFFDDAEYWESIIAECTYEGQTLTEVRLYPITLGYDPGKPLRSQRTTAGVPRLADGRHSGKILNDLRRLSAPYGTAIDVKDNTGIIKI